MSAGKTGQQRDNGKALLRCCRGSNAAFLVLVVSSHSKYTAVLLTLVKSTDPCVPIK